MAFIVTLILMIPMITVTNTVITEVNFGTRISWKVDPYPDAFARDQIDAAIRRGLKMWSNVCNVNFHQTDTNPDVVFKFYSQWEHSQRCDAPLRGAVAHAKITNTIPVEIHILDKPQDYEWTLQQVLKQHYPLSPLIAHEIGHIFGLDNNQDMDSIMHESEMQITELNPDDIAKCQKRYGTRARINSTCPTSVQRYFLKGVDDPYSYRERTKLPTCATIYSHPHCHPLVSKHLEISQIPNLQELNVYANTLSVYYNWLNRISSLVVNPGCEIKVCTGTDYDGDCLMITGDKYGKNVPTLDETFDNAIASLSCICGQQSDENITTSYYASSSISWMNKLKRSAAVPAQLSDGQESCAVLVEKFIAEGRNKLIPKDARYNSEAAIWGYDDWSAPNALTYIATRPQCSLRYCPEAYFSGGCKTLGPNRYDSEGFIIIKSLFCTCNTTDSSAPVQESGNITLTTTTVRSTTSTNLLPNEGPLAPEINGSVGNVTPTATTVLRNETTFVPVDPAEQDEY